MESHHKYYCLSSCDPKLPSARRNSPRAGHEGLKKAGAYKGKGQGE